jgi:hypothetical protein
VSNLSDRATTSQLLTQARDYVESLHARPGLGRIASGLPEYDWRLWQLGRLLLDERQPPNDRATPAHSRGPDIFLATELYEEGGHTALIGDFVAALQNDQAGTAPRLIVTNLFDRHDRCLPDRIRLRTGIAPENVHVISGPSLERRLDELITVLLELRPRNLFLFHHPQDPLASVVGRPEIATQTFLVHHVDARPSLGLHLPGVRVIELNPFAASLGRLRRLPIELLLLTAPDPGPRPCGFLARGRLATATCGSAYKYETDYAYHYEEAVSTVLRTTGGWHHHIGPLSDEALAKISASLKRAKLDSDRFVHVPWVPSLAKALWQHQCDVYLASFPIDGARAYVEVSASATPYLAHRSAPSRPGERWALNPTVAAEWDTLEALASTISKMSDTAVLADHATRQRRSYDLHHHPAVFRRTLQNIMAGLHGQSDPDEAPRDEWMMRSLLETLSRSLIASTAGDSAEAGAAKQAIGEILAATDDLKRHIGQNDAAAETLRRRVDESVVATQELERRVARIEDSLAAPLRLWRKLTGRPGA